MKNIKQIELYKSRGYTACISEAFNTTAHNLKTIFLHTWIYALLTGLTFAAYTSAGTSIMTNGMTLFKAALLFVALLLCICATTALFARSSMLINMRPMRWNVKRAARIMLVILAFAVVVGAVLGVVSLVITGRGQAGADASASTAAGWTLNIAGLVIALLTLPYVYVFAKYMIEPEAKLGRLLFRSYKTGFRHWGFIFTTMFLAYLCMAVCVIITCLPMVIITSARIVSLNGTAVFNDPSGLPAYFDVMQFGLFTAAAFIWSYISIFCLFIYFLMYGSIETREKEKREFMKSI